MDPTDVVATILPKDAWDQASQREAAPTSGIPQPDTMLMIQLKLIDLRGKFDIDPPLALNVKAQVTLTAPSAAMPYNFPFQYQTGARPLTEWTADDAKVFREAVDLSLARLAELIVGDLFLTNSTRIGLKPASPIDNKASDVDPLRPTLRWERFPRAKDLEELGPHAGGRIAAVSYEVRLWKVGKEFPGISNLVSAENGMQRYFDYKYSWGQGCRDADPGELVYRQPGLGQPEHTLEIPLQPNSFYFWTVRAHFTLDGKRRATEWSEQFIRDPTERVEGREHGCSSPATFQLIRTP